MKEVVKYIKENFISAEEYVDIVWPPFFSFKSLCYRVSQMSQYCICTSIWTLPLLSWRIVEIDLTTSCTRPFKWQHIIFTDLEKMDPKNWFLTANAYISCGVLYTLQRFMLRPHDWQYLPIYPTSSKYKTICFCQI